MLLLYPLKATLKATQCNTMQHNPTHLKCRETVGKPLDDKLLQHRGHDRVPGQRALWSCCLCTSDNHKPRHVPTMSEISANVFDVFVMFCLFKGCLRVIQISKRLFMFFSVSSTIPCGLDLLILWHFLPMFQATKSSPSSPQTISRKL